MKKNNEKCRNCFVQLSLTKINNIGKVSVKTKTIRKAKQLHERNSDEMM